jgi:hypothetical protein
MVERRGEPRGRHTARNGEWAGARTRPRGSARRIVRSRRFPAAQWSTRPSVLHRGVGAAAGAPGRPVTEWKDLGGEDSAPEGRSAVEAGPPLLKPSVGPVAHPGPCDPAGAPLRSQLPKASRNRPGPGGPGSGRRPDPSPKASESPPVRRHPAVGRVPHPLPKVFGSPPVRRCPKVGGAPHPLPKVFGSPPVRRGPAVGRLRGGSIRAGGILPVAWSGAGGGEIPSGAIFSSARGFEHFYGGQFPSRIGGVMALGEYATAQGANPDFVQITHTRGAFATGERQADHARERGARQRGTTGSIDPRIPPAWNTGATVSLPWDSGGCGGSGCERRWR